MQKTEFLKHFFDEQHRKWKNRAYTLIHFTCKSAPFISNYGKVVHSRKGTKPNNPALPYHPKRD